MDYTGKLLIATHSLYDSNFRQTVVLVIHGNDEDGVFGVVLNRATGKPIKELWENVFHESCATERVLYLGGPVSGPLVALHSCEELSELEIVPGVHFTRNKADLDELTTDANGPFRFFVGNSGWGEGQLAMEIKEGAWYVVEATRELVFFDDTEIWSKMIEQVGRSMLGEILHTDRLPDDPGVN